MTIWGASLARPSLHDTILLGPLMSRSIAYSEMEWAICFDDIK